MWIQLFSMVLMVSVTFRVSSNVFNFRVQPKYKTRTFYLSGESYAGIYIPMLSQAIVQGINANKFPNPNFQVLVYSICTQHVHHLLVDIYRTAKKTYSFPEACEICKAFEIRSLKVTFYRERQLATASWTLDIFWTRSCYGAHTTDASLSSLLCFYHIEILLSMRLYTTHSC